jgi:hypothetical protein
MMMMMMMNAGTITSAPADLNGLDMHIGYLILDWAMTLLDSSQSSLWVVGYMPPGLDALAFARSILLYQTPASELYIVSSRFLFLRLCVHNYVV